MKYARDIHITEIKINLTYAFGMWFIKVESEVLIQLKPFLHATTPSQDWAILSTLLLDIVNQWLLRRLREKSPYGNPRRHFLVMIVPEFIPVIIPQITNIYI